MHSSANWSNGAVRARESSRAPRRIRPARSGATPETIELHSAKPDRRSRVSGPKRLIWLKPNRFRKMGAGPSSRIAARAPAIHRATASRRRAAAANWAASSANTSRRFARSLGVAATKSIHSLGDRIERLGVPSCWENICWRRAAKAAISCWASTVVSFACFTSASRVCCALVRVRRLPLVSGASVWCGVGAGPIWARRWLTFCSRWLRSARVRAKSAWIGGTAAIWVLSASSVTSGARRAARMACSWLSARSTLADRSATDAGWVPGAGAGV